MKNPYNVLNKQGVPGAPVTALPQNYAFELNMATWWSAVNRARNYSDFTGLDALYSYIMKSSTLVRSAIDKRLRPLKARTFAVMVNGKEDVRLTKKLKQLPFMRELIYQRGLANFTYARVIGVNRDLSVFVYPLRNLDVLNKAVRKMTYDTQDIFYVKSHVNLFWLQTSYQSEDTLGLLEPIARDYINMCNAQNNWQTASQVLAVQQLVMYYENGDEKMENAAVSAAANIGLGKVITAGKSTDENGKVIRDLELENVYGGTAADMFRIFKENIEQLRGAIMQLVLGSSLLGMSEKNTNSERLVRAHLKLFRDICESDATEVQDWLNSGDVRMKLAYILDEPLLESCTFEAKPSSYIDIGDVETYVRMLKDLELLPTAGFIEKTGIDINDVTGYEDAENADKGSKPAEKVRGERATKTGILAMAMDSAKRFYNWCKSRNGQEVAGQDGADPGQEGSAVR